MKQIFNSISGSFDRWCTRFDQWWAKLRCWQRGAALGGALHIFSVFFIYTLVLIFVPVLPPLGSGDMGPASVWILAALSALIEFIPALILHLSFGVTMETTLFAYSGPFGGIKGIFIWFLYMIYSTAFYTFLGMAVAKVIESFKRGK